MLPFDEFDKIHNYDDAPVQLPLSQMVTKDPTLTFAVMEKVDGTNFCVQTDGHTVQCANRNKVLALDARFYGFQSVIERYQDHFKQLFRLVEAAYPLVTSISVYCELFGGFYPDPTNPNELIYDNPPLNRVFYSPDKHFYAFDLKVYPGREIGWIALEQALAWFDAVGLLHSKILARGTYAEMKRWDVETMKTNIPGWLGLPAIGDVDETDTRYLAEGVIIRRVDSRFRVKKKREAFLESRKSASAATNKASSLPSTIADKLCEQRWLSLRAKREQTDFTLTQWVDWMIEDIESDDGVKLTERQKSLLRKKAYEFLRPLIIKSNSKST